MFQMRGFTLEAGYWDFVWPRVILGVGLAMLFVPLSTLTLGSIPKEEMGNATGLYNLLRTVGGSVGIAVCATLLSRYHQFYQNVLVDSVSPSNPVARQQLEPLKQGFMLRGIDAVSADKASLAAIYGIVQRQAGMLAYNHIFWIVGLTFLGVMPFLLLLKRQKTAADSEGVH
jgi:DHA2 family multidrug resistance protein